MSADDEVRAMLAAAVATPPPAGLLGRVRAAATSARTPGTPIESLGGGRSADPVDAYTRTVAELAAAVRGADRALVVQPYGWTITQLLAHLAGIEHYFGAQLGLWTGNVDTAVEDDHLGTTAAAVAATNVADHDRLLGEWQTSADAVRAHLASLDADGLRRRMKFHFLDARLSTLLVVRVFELWTHTEDVCRAARAAAPTLDSARLRLMTETAVAAIPLGMLLSGIDAPDVTARLVLTGSGGGVWNQPLHVGSPAHEPSITIVANALEFCRLAAQRIPTDDLDAEVEGDAAVARNVLRGASVFAA